MVLMHISEPLNQPEHGKSKLPFTKQMCTSLKKLRLGFKKLIPRSTVYSDLPYIYAFSEDPGYSGGVKSGVLPVKSGEFQF